MYNHCKIIATSSQHLCKHNEQHCKSMQHHCKNIANKLTHRCNNNAEVIQNHYKTIASNVSKKPETNSDPRGMNESNNDEEQWKAST